MTLITHIRNKHIGVLIGDTRETGMGVNDNTQKIFKCSDFIAGYYGCVSKVLKLVQNKSHLSFKEFINEFNNLEEKGYSGIIHEALVIIAKDKSYLCLWENMKKGYKVNPYPTIIELYPRVKSNKMAENYSKLNSTGIFFSPFIYFNQMKFDHDVDQERHQVFNDIFKEIYSFDFNIDIITDNDDLRKLIISFYKEVFYNNGLNPSNNIGGNIYMAKYINEKFTEPEFIEIS